MPFTTTTARPPPNPPNVPQRARRAPRSENSPELDYIMMTTCCKFHGLVRNNKGAISDSPGYNNDKVIGLL